MPFYPSCQHPQPGYPVTLQMGLPPFTTSTTICLQSIQKYTLKNKDHIISLPFQKHSNDLFCSKVLRCLAPVHLSVLIAYSPICFLLSKHIGPFDIPLTYHSHLRGFALVFLSDGMLLPG